MYLTLFGRLQLRILNLVLIIARAAVQQVDNGLKGTVTPQALWLCRRAHDRSPWAADAIITHVLQYCW